MHWLGITRVFYVEYRVVCSAFYCVYKGHGRQNHSVKVKRHVNKLYKRANRFECTLKSCVSTFSKWQAPSGAML
jgi:hypothetical protein